MKDSLTKIAVFGSGSGTNAEKIMEHFREHPEISVAAVFSNSASAKILKRAEQFGIPGFSFSRKDFYDKENVLKKLKDLGIDWIILAGFLWLIPEPLLCNYRNRIINIHPALLPKFGGKGMYGDHVHKAVVEAKETESGITVHLIDEEYDRGETLFQARCELLPSDSPETVSAKVRKLEHKYYPEIIEKTILKENSQK